MKQSNEVLVPLSDAAIKMGLSYGAARDRMLRGEILGHRQGRNWVVVAKSLDRWLAPDTKPVGDAADGTA